MSELGQLLELLHDAHREVGTFQAEYRDWARPRPTSELVVHRQNPDDGHPRVHWRGSGPFPPALGRTRRIWQQQPACLRVEVHRDKTLVRFGVLNRARWWWWDAVRGLDTSEAPTDDRDAWWVPPLLAPLLFEPVRLLSALRLMPAGRGVRAGREVLCARALPRAAGSPPIPEHEFEFDAEHGTMLRHVISENRVLVSVAEAIAVAYHRPIRPEHFVFVAPDGKSARRLADSEDSLATKRCSQATL